MTLATCIHNTVNWHIVSKSFRSTCKLPVHYFVIPPLIMAKIKLPTGNIHCATNRTVPGSIPSGVTGDFFRGSPRRNHVPWGRFSLWKWVPGISPGIKAAGAYGLRPTTLVVPNVKKIRGLNLPGTPWATSACCGMTFTFTGNISIVGYFNKILIPRKHVDTCEWKERQICPRLGDTLWVDYLTFFLLKQWPNKVCQTRKGLSDTRFNLSECSDSRLAVSAFGLFPGLLIYS